MYVCVYECVCVWSTKITERYTVGRERNKEMSWLEKWALRACAFVCLFVCVAVCMCGNCVWACVVCFCMCNERK